MWPSSTDGVEDRHIITCVFQSLKRDVAFFHYLCPSAMWPSSTPMLWGSSSMRHSGFNRSSAMWPSSTHNSTGLKAHCYEFQSLKRDVAFFHLSRPPRHRTHQLPVSIAQARCGLLPHGSRCYYISRHHPFQSLKRDVAFFHAIGAAIITAFSMSFNRSSAMWPSSTIEISTAPYVASMFQSLKRDVAFFHPDRASAVAPCYLVSIAQARCGLLPRECCDRCGAMLDVSIAQARCGLLPQRRRGDARDCRL